jgi:putative methyltransferase (TIGR04325 family)
MTNPSKLRSGARQILKRLMPPLLMDLVRGRIGASPEVAGPTWEGVYSKLTDVPTDRGERLATDSSIRAGSGAASAISAAFEDSSRVDMSVGWTRHALSLIGKGQTPSSPWHDALALLAAVVGGRNARVRVLDFGGGVGLGFAYVLATLRTSTAIDYHVVELEKMAAAGRELFTHDPRITFHISIPTFSEGVDIVYMSSVLEYIDDYAGLLRQLAGLGASHILLAQSAVGRIPTYATRQMNVRGHSLPYWFINIDELVGTLSASGYSLAYEADAGPHYDQSNFPETHRIGRMRNLLFIRTTDLQ